MDQDATWYEGRPRPRPHYVTWGPSSPPSKEGAEPSPNFRLMSIAAKRSPISAAVDTCCKTLVNNKIESTRRVQTATRTPPSECPYRARRDIREKFWNQTPHPQLTLARHSRLWTVEGWPTPSLHFPKLYKRACVPDIKIYQSVKNQSKFIFRVVTQNYNLVKCYSTQLNSTSFRGLADAGVNTSLSVSMTL